MIKYITAIMISFSIWILSALINGLLCWVYLSVIAHFSAGLVLLTTVFSLIFSIPGIIAFCIFFLINVITGKQSHLLFRRLIKGAVVCSLLTGLIFYKSLQWEFAHDFGFIICLGAVAAVSAVFIHRSSILLFFKNENHEPAL
ncbi:MAG: hypothetical protein ABJA78_12100 [Ferruginibacter sp.]